MDSRIRCRGKSLKVLGESLLFRQELINGLLLLEELNRIFQEIAERKMLYGQV